MDQPFTLNELGNTYADEHGRYVVSFITSFLDSEVHSPEEAVARALSLSRDEQSYETHWYVFDRKTHIMHVIEQREAELLDDDDAEDADDEENE